MKRVILFSVICFVAIASTGQGINGRVIDEQSQPMPFANVVLVNRSDSAFIQGAVTKDDGTFTIETEKQDGLLKVSSVGYIIRYIDAWQGNVGDIQMQPDTQTLGEVTVKGYRPQYKMTTGGMTVDIQNSLLKDVGTADNVLSMLPRVQGEDGNFTVFTKGTPEIYINNKKVQNARELKQLKSTDIKSVDIITSPGAKYNAEVGAVI
ncbi:MAG: carboxypeptidase-like regulatory domain-containing protein, partial [Prevotella sp.]|nr:carboxypeptidase-like regulatory domain-containing protein [Prevotella sp.]